MSREIDVLVGKLQTIGDLRESDKVLLNSVPLQVSTIRKGTAVVSDGEVGSRTCLLVEGFMHREKLTRAGARQILSFHPSGDIPDLQSLHLHKMDYNLVATSDCRIALINHRDLNVVLEQSATLTALMWRDSLIDSASFRAWMLMLGQADADARMAHLFCEIFVRLRAIGQTRGHRFEFPVTQLEIADAIGVSVVHANRTLQELRSRGLIAVDRSEVDILNWEGLKALAAFDPAYLHYVNEDAGS